MRVVEELMDAGDFGAVELAVQRVLCALPLERQAHQRDALALDVIELRRGGIDVVVAVPSGGRTEFCTREIHPDHVGRGPRVLACCYCPDLSRAPVNVGLSRRAKCCGIGDGMPRAGLAAGTS
jgi:hypothetical protein